MLILDFTPSGVGLKRTEQKKLIQILETEQTKEYFEVYDIRENDTHLIISLKETGEHISTIELSEKSRSLLLSRKPSAKKHTFRVDFIVEYSDNKTYESVIGSLLYLELQQNKATMLSQDDQLYIFFVMESMHVDESNTTVFEEETLPLLPELEGFIREHVQFQAETSVRGVLK